MTASTGTVRQADRLLFLAEKGFELGVNTRLEVQDAELNHLTAHANLARAQRDYRVARIELAWVGGTLDRPIPDGEVVSTDTADTASPPPQTSSVSDFRTSTTTSSSP